MIIAVDISYLTFNNFSFLKQYTITGILDPLLNRDKWIVENQFTMRFVILITDLGNIFHFSMNGQY